ncbi:MAG: hypothetical protein JXC32_17535 [Anaerolineae bacterium]|nr:hypothetical protein [Anaerolineae bacterium]
MVTDTTIGVQSLGAKLFLWAVVLLVALAGCSGRLGQEVEAGVDATATSQAPPSPTVAPLDGTTLVPTAPADEPPVAATEATPVPSPTGVVVPTPTSTPDVCPYLRGRTEIGTLSSTAMGEQPRFLVHLPPCYDRYTNQVFPTLYLFHGWPLDEWHWIDLGLADWVDDWVSRGLIGPFIIVLPGVSENGRYINSSGGDGSFEGFVVNELVPHIDANYRTITDPSGRAVGGISRGGVWALEIALRHQDVFSSVGGHSPALSVNNPLPQYDPFLLIREDVSGLRFYLDAGDIDWTRASVIRLRDALLERGADVTYEVHQGNHVDALWQSGVPDYVAFYAAAWPPAYEALPDWTERDRPIAP